MTVQRPRLAIFGLFLTLVSMTNAQGVISGTSTQITSSAGSSSFTVDPYKVAGRVVNGATGAGVPRALVTLMSRHALTDAQGNFQFAAFTLAHGTLNVTKPGYSNSPDGQATIMRLLGQQDLTAPLELKLYPNPILMGIVTGRDGLPISRVLVRLFVFTSDINGERWSSQGGAMTDSHGQYRFNPAPGTYRVSVNYAPHAVETGEVVLPVSFPELSSTDKSGNLTLVPGQERRVDLHPRTGTPYPVSLRVEPSTARNVRFSVTSSAGDGFFVAAEGSESGEYHLSLPTGTFTIRCHMDDKDMSLEGSAHVAVTSSGASATVQLAPLTNIPVEVVVDPGSSTVTTATASPQQLQQPNARSIQP